MKVYTDIAGHEYWYDASQRCWYCAAVNEDGDLGESQSAYTKEEIIDIAEADVCEKPEGVPLDFDHSTPIKIRRGR